jgi:hypothetical protein
LLRRKSLRNPLVNRDAASPDGFSQELGEEIESAVLRGYAVFSETDARAAGAALLNGGPLRIKPSREKGGLGQVVVSNQNELCETLTKCDLAEMAKFGLVLEENLLSVETCSVGFISVGVMSIAYYGTQILTPNNHQSIVYGGSNLSHATSIWRNRRMGIGRLSWIVGLWIGLLSPAEPNRG